MNYFDEQEIQKTIAIMKPNNKLFEVRIVNSAKKGSIVGYFTSADVLIEQLKRQNLKGKNIYITLNVPNEACYSRQQKDHFVDGASTTSDKDIEAYDWLMIDLDPERPSGVSSSDEELKAAKDLGNKVYQYMASLGFEKPLLAFSGNGVHLLYKVNISNTPNAVEVFKSCLKALSIMFSTDQVKIDTANFNPSRVCKLYGTLAQKGIDDVKRPHRMARIIGNPTEIKATDAAYLQALAATLPKEPDKPQKYNNYRPIDFDLGDWLFNHNINYRKVSESDCDKYVLDECPFDSSHKAPDACIFKLRNGAIGFKCFHNSCQGYTWKDVRIKYEPDAYDRQRQYEDRQLFGTFNRNVPKEIPKIVEDEIPTEFTPEYMKNRPKEQRTYIKTGITDFDNQYIGLEKKRVTLLSGYSGGAKSTLLSQIMLNAINEGNRVYCFSGELDSTDLYSWIMLQAAGKNNTEPIESGFYKVKDEVKGKILDWMKGKFWLYNNDKGYNFEAIKDHLREKIRELKIDLVCIDNLMAMDITDLAESKNEQQKKFLWELHELAMEENVHIVIVCHPKKPIGLLTMYDVSGASEIVNTADNILYVYRVNQQFKNAYASFFGHSYDTPGTNCWHMAKARHGSLSEDYFPLYYETETKRLKNSLADHKSYGWDNDFRPATEWELQFEFRG